MKAFKTPKMNVFWRWIIEMSSLKCCSVTCSDQSEWWIAPILDRFGHLLVKILAMLQKVPHLSLLKKNPQFVKIGKTSGNTLEVIFWYGEIMSLQLISPATDSFLKCQNISILNKLLGDSGYSSSLGLYSRVHLARESSRLQNCHSHSTSPKSLNMTRNNCCCLEHSEKWVRT